MPAARERPTPLPASQMRWSDMFRIRNALPALPALPAPTPIGGLDGEDGGFGGASAKRHSVGGHGISLAAD